MKKKTSLIIIALIAGVSVTNLNAQTDSCIVNLKTANLNFEQRDFDGTIKLLQKTLNECSFDKEDKIQSHKLLALSYLAIDNLEAADKEAEAIIKIDPNYTPDKFKDDSKLIALFEKYKPIPVFRVGISAGINRTMIDVVNTHSIIHDDDAENLGTYNGKTGFQLGMSAEYRAYKNLWVQLEGQFRQSNYEHILNNIENTTVNYSEKLSYLDIPLSGKYYFLEGALRKFVTFHPI